ncbi:MAG: hypothetical protein KJO45_05475, partial [Sulfurovum sp.]|nr:hypothetical protein [Sulfurovum sp.]
MKLSFKYRFIISFVLLEILFLAMIASVNFSSLEQNSQRLINERINALKSLGNELVVTPLSVYDLATLDNILSGLSELEGVEKISLFDAQGKKLSEVGDTNQLNGSLIKIDKEITFESMKLGMLHFWMDLSQNYAEINSNRSLTLKIIFLEIILSIIISYIIGFRLSRDLEKLTEYVRLIGEKGTANVPTLNGKDEVTELANAMNIMQTKIN